MISVYRFCTQYGFFRSEDTRIERSLGFHLPISLSHSRAPQIVSTVVSESEATKWLRWIQNLISGSGRGESEISNADLIVGRNWDSTGYYRWILMYETLFKTGQHQNLSERLRNNQSNGVWFGMFLLRGITRRFNLLKKGSLDGTHFGGIKLDADVYSCFEGLARNRIPCLGDKHQIFFHPDFSTFSMDFMVPKSYRISPLIFSYPVSFRGRWCTSWKWSSSNLGPRRQRDLL